MKTKAVKQLSTLLSEGIDVHRCAAARALGVLKGSEANKVLITALLDEDPDVRVDVVTALADIGNPADGAKLMENLVGDPDGAVKKTAITALVAMRHAPVIPLLRALAVSRAEEQVAWDENDFYTDGWDTWDDVQLAAIKGLGTLGVEEAVPDILEAMADEMGQDVSEPAFQALVQLGAAGARALTLMYEIDDARLSRRIARAAGASKIALLDDLRGTMLGDKSATIRALALQNLDASDPRISKMLADEDAGVRATAVCHHGATNLSRLGDMIKDDAPQVRIEVFKNIATYPDEFTKKSNVEAVKNAVKGDPEAAKHAALALFALEGPKVANGFTHVLTKQDVPLEFRLGVLETLEKAGQAAVPALLGVAGDPDRQLRLASLTVLANIAADDAEWPNDAGTGLLEALNGELVLAPEEPEEEVVAPEPEPEIELDAAELEEIAREIDESVPLVAEDAAPGSTLHAIMANVPDDSVPEPEPVILNPEQERMLELTKVHKFSKRKVSWQTEVAPFLDVRRFSARLLGQVEHPEVTAALVKALAGDIDAETREGVLFSLAEHGAKTGALPADLRGIVDGLLENDTSEIRVLATRLLGFLPDNDIPEKLLELLTNEDPLMRVEAIRALNQRDLAGPEVTNALWDSYLGTGIAAAHALARINGDAAVADLVEYAMSNDGIYRRDIGRLLGQYAPETGAVHLLDLLNDEDRKSQWLVAIDALAELFQHQNPDQERLVA